VLAHNGVCQHSRHLRDKVMRPFRQRPRNPATHSARGIIPLGASPATIDLL